jgi:glycogen synthase
MLFSSVICHLQVRFDFFCKAALEFLLKTGRQPDILHCHDWSTAHVAKSFWEDYQPYGLSKPKVLAGNLQDTCRKPAGSPC